MHRIIYSTPDGGVVVIIPAAECGLSIEAIAAKDVPVGTAYHIVDTSDVPSDRTFRNAWELQSGRVEHNMAKCGELTKDRLRRDRQPLLEAQDVAYMRATEAGADTSAIVAEKQRLRDVTKLATPGLSLEALKGLSV